jgi:hypothetical protein
MKRLGETKKPHTIYGWDEFVSSETIKKYVEEQK